MLFNSYPFLVFIIVVFFLYYIPLFKNFQVSVLIVASLFFYAYSEPYLLLLLLGSISINIWSSYYIVYGKKKYQKLYAVLGVSLNLSLLLFFKYSPLVGDLISPFAGDVGSFLLQIPLPIGISFFTFQGISLVVDVYRGRVVDNGAIVGASLFQHAKKTIFFKAFFPQLVAGPIVKAHDFYPQIKVKLFSEINWEKCFKTIILGFFLKAVVADNLKEFSFWISYPYFEIYSSTNLAFLLLGYSFQIFADFSGYSLIAIGLAKLFGYDFFDNFNFPYISSSFKDFWKRWHISLSSFLMEYLYVPLGGNKKGKIRTYINLMLVMVLGGLWHGATLSYAVWGAYHGLLLVIERFTFSYIKEIKNIFYVIFKMLLVFTLVTFGWLLFKLPDFDHVISFMDCLFTGKGSFTNTRMIAYIIIYGSFVVIYHLGYLLEQKNEKVKEFNSKYSFVFYAVMLFLIITNSGSSGAFIYFQF